MYCSCLFRNISCWLYKKRVIVIFVQMHHPLIKKKSPVCHQTEIGSNHSLRQYLNTSALIDRVWLSDLTVVDPHILLLTLNTSPFPKPIQICTMYSIVSNHYIKMYMNTYTHTHTHTICICMSVGVYIHTHTLTHTHYIYIHPHIHTIYVVI